MNRRFVGAFLGVLIYKAVVWAIDPAASQWSDEALEAVAIAALVTVVWRLQDWWHETPDPTADEAPVS